MYLALLLLLCLFFRPGGLGGVCFCGAVVRPEQDSEAEKERKREISEELRLEHPDLDAAEFEATLRLDVNSTIRSQRQRES